MRIGVDTGGTFTDFVFYDNETIKTLKLPSTPKNPVSSILSGLKPFLEKKFTMIYGTTIATNSFLQKKMAKTAFLCTKGFKHILHIGRQTRINLFSLHVEKPPSMVPISLCYGIDERTSNKGIIRKKPDRSEIIKLCEELKSKRVQSISIVFLHSYKNPQNEKVVSKIFKKFYFVVKIFFFIL